MKGFIRNAGVYVWHSIVCGAMLALIVTAFWAVSYTLSVHRRHQAERLLQDLKGLQSGAAGLQRARQLADEYGAVRQCSAQECTYKFKTGFSYTNSGSSLVLSRTEWDYAGLRPWDVTAGIEVRNNEVASVEVDVLVARGRGWLHNDGLFSGNEWGWWLVSLMQNSGRYQQQADIEKEYVRENSIRRVVHAAGEHGLIVSKPVLNIGGGGEALSVYLSPAATADSKAVGFDINLRCATAMSPCTELCQVAPSAWQSYSVFQRSNGWHVDEPRDCAVR